MLAATAALAIRHREPEVALREAEAFLQDVMTASTDCIKVLDLAGRLQWISENGLCAMQIADFANFQGTRWVETWPDPMTRCRRAPIS